MTDTRLRAGLTAWLHDSDVPGPDARMSAGRIMAGIELSPQLGRWWPPDRLVSRVGPVPALGAPVREGAAPPPSPPSPEPPWRAQVRSQVTPVRALASLVVLAFAGGTLLIAASLLPGSGGQAAVAIAGATAQPTLTAEAAVTADPATTSEPAVAPAPRTMPSPVPSDRPIDWTSGRVRLEADGLSLRIRDRVFTPPSGTQPEAAPAAAALELAVGWSEESREHRLVLELGTDDAHWWVARARAHDGTRKPGWLYFDDAAAMTRTPLGEPIELDLELPSTGADRTAWQAPGSASLHIERLRLTLLATDA